MYKEIRIIARRGKYSLRTVVFDDDGDVVRIQSDEVDVWSRDLEEFKRILAQIAEARAKPILHVTSSTAHLYGLRDLDIGED